jgi:hypothetical protein
MRKASQAPKVVNRMIVTSVCGLWCGCRWLLRPRRSCTAWLSPRVLGSWCDCDQPVLWLAAAARRNSCVVRYPADSTME